jgi:hypothetical protein
MKPGKRWMPLVVATIVAVPQAVYWGLIWSILGFNLSPPWNLPCGTWGADCGQALYPWPRPWGGVCLLWLKPMTPEENILCMLATSGAFIGIIVGSAAVAFWSVRRHMRRLHGEASLSSCNGVTRTNGKGGVGR